MYYVLYISKGFSDWGEGRRGGREGREGGRGGGKILVTVSLPPSRINESFPTPAGVLITFTNILMATGWKFLFLEFSEIVFSLITHKHNFGKINQNIMIICIFKEHFVA